MFLKASNLIGVANQTAVYAVIAIGMTMVIITGGIDLSVGSLVALASVIATIIIRDHGGAFRHRRQRSTFAFLIAILAAAAAGALERNHDHGVSVAAFYRHAGNDARRSWSRETTVGLPVDQRRAAFVSVAGQRELVQRPERDSADDRAVHV